MIRIKRELIEKKVYLLFPNDKNTIITWWDAGVPITLLK